MPEITRKVRTVSVGGPQTGLSAEQLAALKAMAAEMAKQMIDELISRGAIGNTIVVESTRMPQDARSRLGEGYDPTISIDERLVDVGVSTKGLEKGGVAEPLASSSTVADPGMDTAKSKLKDILSKKGG